MGTLNAVSFMPSGAKMRSRRKVSSVLPVAREIRMPRISEPLLYIHFSPGWCASGRPPQRFISSSGECAGRFAEGETPASDIAFWIGCLSG